MSDIHYTLKFYSDWHCGSGLASGADVDELVVKDGQGIPFVPGKTLKGLVKEAVELICELRGISKGGVDKAFGKPCDNKGEAFFTNAELPELERKAIISNNQQEFLFRKLTSTAVGEGGIALDSSLRAMEVTVPCELEGDILNIPDDIVGLVSEGLKLVKRLGLDRNRGLGRCGFSVSNKK